VPWAGHGLGGRGRGGPGGFLGPRGGFLGRGAVVTVSSVSGQTITATAGATGAGKAISGPGFGFGRPYLGAAAPFTVTITVSSTTVYTQAGQSATLGDIQPGSVLRVQGTRTGQNAIAASAIEIVLPVRAGVVTAINGDNLTITGFDARQSTITLGSSTVYQRAGQTAARTDIAVGSLISAEGTLSSDRSTLTALRVTIQLPRVTGKVTAVSGDDVTVQGFDGSSTTVHLTASTTYAAAPQGTASKASITSGVYIGAEGTVGSDGSLTALAVRFLNVGGVGNQGGQAQGFGGGFQGFGSGGTFQGTVPGSAPAAPAGSSI
jgi:hypothetical protein